MKNLISLFIVLIALCGINHAETASFNIDSEESARSYLHFFEKKANEQIHTHSMSNVNAVIFDQKDTLTIQLIFDKNEEELSKIQNALELDNNINCDTSKYSVFHYGSGLSVTINPYLQKTLNYGFNIRFEIISNKTMLPIGNILINEDECHKAFR
ncbi:hypothetical protein MTZ49_04755 [Entomomonas sp. E2T0]|uniref:hypothetical protein n=1 Tax=Entomomonas sp. E2T0 TaxID=2930213 RepID=UPI0022283BA6|nr:hypothetical protein [Entomomonas sp. E2T0]UYZ84881.1 hypothetical protein MTZ49_04755 [Entomomonas sp. E2T0]